MVARGLNGWNVGMLGNEDAQKVSEFCKKGPGFRTPPKDSPNDMECVAVVSIGTLNISQNASTVLSTRLHTAVICRSEASSSL